MSKTEQIHLRFTLTGEPARILRRLKKRGIVNTFPEGIRQAMYAYKDMIDARDLTTKQLTLETET